LSSPPSRPRLLNAAIALASVLLTAAALEIAARVFSDPTAGNAALVAEGKKARAMSVHVKSDDPELIYVTRPDYVTNGVAISESHGILRRSPVSESKSADTFRIAVLGDSIAAAHPLRVGGAASFADEMETRLNARAGRPRFEVLNFGTDGYGSLQEARLLETKVAPFAPDAVVVAYCLNDPSNSYTPTVWFLDDPGPRSYLLDLLRRRLHRTPSELSPAHPRYTHGTIEWDRLYRADGPNWAGVLQALARMARFGESHHVPTLLAMFPLLLTGNEPPEEQEQVQRMYEQVKEAAAQFGLRFLDLRAAFRDYSAAQLRLLPDDPIHPNALGHRLAGDAIAARLAADGLLPAEGPLDSAHAGQQHP
jgi:lysophospholipase L1-like esterase